jgi:hypothetical protein
MTGTMTPTERLSRMDREVEELKQAFVDAATQLSEAPEVDNSHDERWEAITRRVRDLRSDLQPADYDKDQLAEFYDTLLDIRDLMDEVPQTLDTIDQLLISTERVRHVVRDALDEHVAGVFTDVGLVVDEMLKRLPGVKRDAVAELVGVDRRTVARWAKQSGPPSRRLATVARLVAILRYNWTPEGIIAWFHRGRRDLGEKKPITLLNEDRFDEDALIAAARAGRSQYAS